MALHRLKTGHVSLPPHIGVLAVNSSDSPPFTSFPGVSKVLPLHFVAYRITKAGTCLSEVGERAFEVGEFEAEVGEFQCEVGEFDVEVGEKAPEVVVKIASGRGEISLSPMLSTKIVPHRAGSQKLIAGS